MGLVIVKECEPESVGELMVTTNAVTPLLLIDGEEIIGAKQKGIINKSTIIPAKTTIKISVSCTEKVGGNIKMILMKNFHVRHILQTQILVELNQI